MINRKTLLAVFLLIGLFTPSVLAADEAHSAKAMLDIATVDNRPLAIDRLIYMALKDIDYETTIKTAASLQQGYTLANNGEKDGVISATPNMEIDYPNLRRVNVKLDHNSPTIFLRKGSALNINTWSDLSGLNVGILTQRVYIQNSIPKDSEIIVKETTPMLFAALAQGEVDVVILAQRGHEQISLPNNIICDKPIEELAEYLYIHESKEYLIPYIEKALTDIFADGRGEKILSDIPMPELYRKQTVIHIYSTTSEVAREERFTTKLRAQFEDDDSIEWYSVALDSKRFSVDPNRMASYANLLRLDCVSRNVSAIIVSDNEALDFIKNYYYLFFRNVPVLFYGALDMEDDLISGYEQYFTGVSAQLSALETVEAALKLFPGTNILHVINDYTPEGRRYQAEIEAQLEPQLKALGVVAEYSENIGRDELMEHIEALPSGSIVLVGSYFKDANEQYFSLADMKRVLGRSCKVPIVSLYAADAPYNSVGGKLLDYQNYADVIAGMLKRVLAGESVSNIPVIYDSAQYNRWVFNKIVMDEWGVKEKALPLGSDVINKTLSVWEANPAFAFGMIGLVFLSISAVVLTQIYRRNDKIVKKKLQEAALSAEEASRTKSAFLANMSHEIRTPMNGIIGFSELALGDDIPVKTEDYLNKIKASSEGLLKIINNILDISKIEAGKMQLENIPFDLHEVFNLCQTITMPKAAEKGISLFCYAEPSVGKRLLGDPTRLRQVMLNLLSNAVKFTDTGMVKLFSAITETTDNSVTMRFEVKDSGIGMSPEQIKRIFVPFTQANSSTTRKYGGTGLGLSIAKNMIELMGGELSVESAPGLGSKFSFNLTFKTIDAESAFPQESLGADRIERPEFNGEILVCEDNVLNQQVICEHLSRVGLSTVVAVNGKDGVDLVRRRKEANEKPFDIIFMDIHMPVMDGLEAAKAIAKLDVNTPIIALTANVMQSDKDVYRSCHMFDCVAKPFTAQELWVCLLRYLKPIAATSLNKTEHSEADKKLRKRLMINFEKDNEKTFENITSAVNAGDIKLAHRLVHTLKGVSGLIGKTDLQEAARVIEQSLRGQEAEFTPGQMKTLEIELDAALKDVRKQIEQSEDHAEESKELEKSKIIQLLDQLELQLKSNNFDCLDLTDDLKAIPDSESLISHIENFDFAPACDALAELRQTLN